MLIHIFYNDKGSEIIDGSLAYNESFITISNIKNRDSNIKMIPWTSIKNIHFNDEV